MKYENSLNISIKLDIEDLKKGGKEAQNAIENISKKLPLIKSNIEMGIDKKKYITELHNLEYTIQKYNKNLKVSTIADFKTEGIQKFNSVLNQTKTILNETNRGLGGFLQRSGDMVKFIAYDIGKSIIPALSSLLKVSINIEKIKTSYISLFQNIEEGEQSFAEIRKYANITPFSTEDLIKTAGILKSVNIETRELIKIIDRLGNLAKGDAEVMNSLAIAYSRMRAKEKIQLEELNIFTERGIPIVQELAKSYNTTTAQIYEMVSKGKIGFTELDKAINSLTEKGGMFSKGIETGANTLSGKLSTLKDAFADMLDSLGEKTLPYLKIIIDSLTNSINILSGIFKKIPSIITFTILSFSVLAGTIQTVHLATGGLIPSLGAIYNSLKLLASQTIILNGAMTGLTLGGLAGLVAAFAGLAFAIGAVIKYNNELTKSYKSIQENEKLLEDAIKKREQAEKNAEKGGKFREAYIEALQNEQKVIEELRLAYDGLSEAEKKKTLDNLSRAIKQDSQTIEEYTKNIQNLTGKERAEAEQQLKIFKEKLDISKKLYEIYTKPIVKSTGQAGAPAQPQIELKSQSFEGLRLSEKIKLQMEIDPNIDKQALLKDIQAKIDEIEKSGDLQAKLQILSEDKTIKQKAGESDTDFEKRVKDYNELRKQAQEYINEYIALKNLKENIIKADEQRNKKEVEYIDNLEFAKLKLEEGVITQAQYIDLLKQRNEANKQELSQLLSKENLTKEDYEKLKEILAVKKELLEFQERENQEKEEAKRKLQEELDLISQIATKVASIGKRLGLSDEMAKLADITANMVSDITKVIYDPADIVAWIGIIENAIDGIMTALDAIQSNSQSNIRKNLQDIESITNNITSEIEYWNTQFSITERNLNNMEKSLSKIDERIRSVNEAMKNTNDLIEKANERQELSNRFDVESIKRDLEKLRKDKEEIEKLNSYSITRKSEIDTNISSLNSDKANIQNYIASLDKAIKEKEKAYNSILAQLQKSYSGLTKDNISSYITSIAGEKYSYNTLLSSISMAQSGKSDKLLWYEMQKDKREQLKKDLEQLKKNNLIGDYDYYILSELSAGKWMWKSYVDTAFKNIQDNIKSKIGVLDSNISQLNSLVEMQNSIGSLTEQMTKYSEKITEINQKINELNEEKGKIKTESTNDIDNEIEKYQNILKLLEDIENSEKKRKLIEEKNKYIENDNEKQELQALINKMLDDEIILLEKLSMTTNDIIKKSELEVEILKRKKQLEGNITAELEKQRNLRLSELEKQLKVGLLDAENWIDQEKIKRVLADLNFSLLDQAVKLQEIGATNNIATKTVNIGNIQTVINQADPDDYQNHLLTIIRRTAGQI